jgi:anthranilate phosphoribosyltransferase
MSDRADMSDLIGHLLDGQMDDDDAVLFLSDLDIYSLTPEAIAGAVEAVMARMVAFPSFPTAIDGCGTGGDGQHTYNISTAAALVAASAGAVVAKHGNRAVTSQSGSADVLEALGVKTNLSPARSAEILKETGIAFLFAPSFHQGFARTAPLRKKVGHRTIFNLLGPLCNPAKVERQLIGVFDAHFCPIIAEAAKMLGRTHMMVVHGLDGSDELSVIDTTSVSTLAHGTITSGIIRPEDAGIDYQDAGDLIGGTAIINARALREVLEAKPSAYMEATIMNAGAMLMVGDIAPTLYDGATLARQAIETGIALKKLEQLITVSNRA